MSDNSSAIPAIETVAYTAGHGLGVPSPGGWAVTVTTPTIKPRGRTGRERVTTEIRQQLTAAIEGLRFFKRGGPDVLVVATPVAMGLDVWEWAVDNRRFRKLGADLMANADLWLALLAELEVRPHVEVRADVEVEWGDTDVDPLMLEGVAGMARDQARKADYSVQ